MRWLAVSLVFAGCASAGPGNVIIGGLSDAGTRGSAGDGGAAVVLSQNASSAVTPANSFNCNTDQTSYYRVFALADFGVTSTLHVTEVDFGIETAATAPGGSSQPATVNLGSYSGTAGGDTLDLSLVTALGSTNIQIANGDDTAMAVPITADVAPGAQLIVELSIPATTQGGNQFFIGTNTADERAPGYLRSDGCGLAAPTSMQSYADSIGGGLGKVHLVLSVTGDP